MGLYLIAAFSMQALSDRAWQIGSVAVGLGFVIFVHELGHFLVAKWFGVKCEKFYVGFDVPIKIFGFQLPSKLVHFQWGETEYGIGIIPLGGYVKMLGQDDDPRAAQQELDRIRIKKNQGQDEGNAATSAEHGTAATETPAEANANTQNYVLDPRSFPAKTVPQRMGIISAGVIMNLIFAVIFATFAFRAGVPYTPCEVGGVVPGSPAWNAGIEAQSHIVQVGNRERRKAFLRFDWDLSNGVNMVDDGEDLLIVTRNAEGEEHSFQIRPSVSHALGFKRRLLGIAPARTTQLSAEPPAMPGTSAAQATPKLQGGDVITAIDGTAVKSAHELEAALAMNPTNPITLTIERSSKVGSVPASKTVEEIVIAPNFIKRLGLVMKTGPIVGLRPDSPATRAGFQIGDILETIAGEPLQDPMSLPTQIRPYLEQEIEVQVRRGGELVTLRVTPQTPTSFDWTFSENSPMAAVALGLAFDVVREVRSVVPGSPAEAEGIQPGDIAVEFRALHDDPQTRAETRANNEAGLKIDDTNLTWPFVFNAIQNLQPKHTLSLTMQRGSQTQEFRLKPQVTDEINPDRGLWLTMKQETYVAQSWREAALLGAGRTWEDAQRVFLFLRKLVTRKIALSNLGGPLTIAAVAGSEASEGLPRLLIFLTFLSANLAVVNFMPIPALDGGHFIFLLWEGISGKPVNERVQIALTLAGVGCLLCLMIFVVGLDINRLFF